MYHEFLKFLINQHHEKCNGPCNVNDFGFPICNLSSLEIERIDKMQAGFILLIESNEDNELQLLLDLSFQPHLYDQFIRYIKIRYNVNI